MPEGVRHGIAILALLVGCAAAQARAVSDEDALARAVRANDVGGAQEALAKHANPNQRLAFGASPLAWAVNTQNPDMVAALLSGGAKVNIADADGVTPLALACELGNAGVVTQLLDAHADVRAAGPNGATPLAICARYGPAEAVPRMLEMGAAADPVDGRGQTPLMWAASSGRAECVAPLLKAGADVNRVSAGGFTPLFFAIKNGNPEAVEALLKVGAKADYRGPENTSAAQLALYQHKYAVATLLVARGADVAERDREGRQLLHAAAEGGDATLVSALLANGADANGLTGPSRVTWVTEANFGRPPPPVPPMTALLIAAANGREAAMKLLLARGADPHFVAQDGTNIVLAAAKGGSAAALDLALTLAPDANVVNAAGWTPLHILVGSGVQPELGAMLRVLAAHGARTDIKDKRGATVAAMADGGLTEVRTIFREVFPDKSVQIAEGGGQRSTQALPLGAKIVQRTLRK